MFKKNHHDHSEEEQELEESENSELMDNNSNSADSEQEKKTGLFSGVKLLHGPINFMFFGRRIILSNGKQIGFLAGFIALLVMIVSTISVFGNLNDTKLLKEQYETERFYLEIIDKAKKGTDENYKLSDSIAYYYLEDKVYSINVSYENGKSLEASQQKIEDCNKLMRTYVIAAIIMILILVIIVVLLIRSMVNIFKNAVKEEKHKKTKQEA